MKVCFTIVDDSGTGYMWVNLTVIPHQGEPVYLADGVRRIVRSIEHHPFPRNGQSWVDIKLGSGPTGG